MGAAKKNDVRVRQIRGPNGDKGVCLRAGAAERVCRYPFE